MISSLWVLPCILSWNTTSPSSASFLAPCNPGFPKHAGWFCTNENQTTVPQSLRESLLGFHDVEHEVSCAGYLCMAQCITSLSDSYLWCQHSTPISKMGLMWFPFGFWSSLRLLKQSTRVRFLPTCDGVVYFICHWTHLSSLTSFFSTYYHAVLMFMTPSPNI